MLAPIIHPICRWHISKAVILAVGMGLFTGLALAGPPTEAYRNSSLINQQAAKANSPSVARFCNPSLITIPDFGASTPYPSQIEVSGLRGAVSNVTADLYGIGHDFYGDIDILLVGPRGQNVLLMSDACDTCPARGVNLSFQDDMMALPSICPVSNTTY